MVVPPGCRVRAKDEQAPSTGTVVMLTRHGTVNGLPRRNLDERPDHERRSRANGVTPAHGPVCENLWCCLELPVRDATITVTNAARFFDTRRICAPIFRSPSSRALWVVVLVLIRIARSGRPASS